jgi:hypothetical protein
MSHNLYNLIDNLEKRTLTLEKETHSGLQTGQAILNKAKIALKEVEEIRKYTWPDEVVFHPNQFYYNRNPLDRNLWRGNVRHWIHDYLTLHRSNFYSQINLLRNIANRITTRCKQDLNWVEKDFNPLYEKTRGLVFSLRNKAIQINDILKSIQPRIYWFLVELPLSYLVWPHGIARFISLNKGRPHYQAHQLRSIMAGRRSYRKVARLLNGLEGWVPPLFMHSFEYKSLKLEFYLGMVWLSAKQKSQLLDRIYRLKTNLEKAQANLNKTQPEQELIEKGLHDLYFMQQNLSQRRWK